MTVADRGYRICSKCVMDTSDPDIVFDSGHICNHCHTRDAVIERLPLGPAREATLREMIQRLKRRGASSRYDCVIGVSGGVDSTYVAWLMKRKFGLRPLAVHVDNGWNSELAVNNIQIAMEKLGIDLYTHVLDWSEFRDLQLAFLRASTPDSEIPTDHAIFACLFDVARKHGIKTVVSGLNVRTETHLPRAWSSGHFDWKYIKSVQRQHGTVPLRAFPHQSLMRLCWNRMRIEWVDILNLMETTKQEAVACLQQDLGWRPYGGKHHESIYTRFYQGHILPKKFGFDKRRCHLSSQICSGEISREAALKELSEPPYSIVQQEEDRLYVLKKLRITETEFSAIMALPRRKFVDYPSYAKGITWRMLVRGQRFYRWLRTGSAEADSITR